jgi:hypothetical protein
MTTLEVILSAVLLSTVIIGIIMYYSKEDLELPTPYKIEVTAAYVDAHFAVMCCDEGESSIFKTPGLSITLAKSKGKYILSTDNNHTHQPLVNQLIKAIAVYNSQLDNPQACLPVYKDTDFV